MEKFIATSKHDMTNRILKNPGFVSDIKNKSLKLSDILVLYNDGFNWKGVPLEIMSMYPVIQDQHDSGKTISVYVCPYTLFSCVYFDNFTPSNQVYNTNLILQNKNNIFIPILNNTYTKDMSPINNTYIRKSEVKIMSMRNAISSFPDCQFIDIQKIEKKEPIVNISNYPIHKFSDKYEAKQIIYIIEYHSKKQDTYKYTVIVPKNNVFDISKNKFGDYFSKMIDKIRDKGGHIYTCYWYAFSSTHENFKIISI